MVSRHIMDWLQTWKDSPRRKPLLLRGARQVGKAFAVRRFAETYPLFLEVNFDVVNKGSIAEVFVGQELVTVQSSREPANLYYWHREARSSNAEVDYVFTQGEQLVPVEVKAGGSGSMQSIRLFMRERNLSKGIRTSLENFGVLQELDIVPLYAVSSYFEK